MSRDRPSKGNAAVLCGFHGTISSHASGQSSRKIQGKSQSKGGQKGTPSRCLGIMIYIWSIVCQSSHMLAWVDWMHYCLQHERKPWKLVVAAYYTRKNVFFWQRGFAFDIDQFRCCKCGNTILVVWGCRSTMFDATHGRIKSAIASNSLLSSNQERLKTYRVIRTLCKHGTWRAPLIGTR